MIRHLCDASRRDESSLHWRALRALPTRNRTEHQRIGSRVVQPTYRQTDEGEDGTEAERDAGATTALDLEPPRLDHHECIRPVVGSKLERPVRPQGHDTQSEAWW